MGGYKKRKYSTKNNKFAYLAGLIDYSLPAEWNSQLPKSILRRHFSKGKCYISSQKKLNPFHLTGLVDTAGCFLVRVSNPVKWSVFIRFVIKAHIADLSLFNEIPAFFGVGSITVQKSTNSCQYSVGKLDEIVNVIILLNFPKCEINWF